jgi:hypothetical protein
MKPAPLLAVTLWKTIPGVDRLTAVNLVAEIGVNMEQFFCQLFRVLDSSGTRRPNHQETVSVADLCSCSLYYRRR